MQNEAIEASGPNGNRLRLDLLWRGDRYGQRITLCNADGSVQPLLESIEGSAHDDWPPSPPLQSLTIEKLADGHLVALLLGMAGKSHWSASIEAVPDKAALIFDIACRHDARPGPLSSRYQQLTKSPNHLQIRADSAGISQQEKYVEIQPTDTATSNTTRWRYTLRLC
jgi:hypothetical protein